MSWSKLLASKQLQHHKPTAEEISSIEAVRLALGPSIKELADYFETCRRMRNVIDYDSAEVASEIQSYELLEKAMEYKKIVDGWILKHHHQFSV